jgi:hypothetical protein
MVVVLENDKQAVHLLFRDRMAGLVLVQTGMQLQETMPRGYRFVKDWMKVFRQLGVDCLAQIFMYLD